MAATSVTFGILAFVALLASIQGMRNLICPYPSEDEIYFSYPYNCSEYYECYNGDLIIRPCPSGLYWNEDKLQCDYPDNVICHPSSTIGPWTPDPLCPYPSTDAVFYPYPTDCNKFIECFSGNKFIRECPSDLWWNENTLECDYPKNVDCTISTTTEAPTTTTPVTTSEHGFKCPTSSETSYYPYAGDCTKYIQCHGGFEVVFNCPKGLFWNQPLLRCDYVCQE